MVNVNNVLYSFDQAKKRGVAYSSFNRAITEIIGRGFFSISKHGSGLQNDPNGYAWGDAWQKWGTPDFQAGVRPKAISGAGFKRGNTLGRKFRQA